MTSKELKALQKMHRGGAAIGMQREAQASVALDRDKTCCTNSPKTFTCKLPLPPSVNGLYPTCRGRRRKSEEYVKWLMLAELSFLNFIGASLTRSIAGPVQVRYDFFFPNDKRRRDGENYCKAVSDFLVARGVIEDDSTIVEMTWHKLTAINEAPFVQVTVTEF